MDDRLPDQDRIVYKIFTYLKKIQNVCEVKLLHFQILKWYGRMSRKIYKAAYEMFSKSWPHGTNNVFKILSG